MTKRHSVRPVALTQIHSKQALERAVNQPGYRKSSSEIDRAFEVVKEGREEAFVAIPSASWFDCSTIAAAAR